MSAFKSVLVRELHRLKQSPYVLLTVFVLPLLFISMTMITFSAGAHTDLPIAVLDEDGSKLSNTLIRQIDATKSCKVEYKLSNIKEAQNMMAKGDIYALIVIPKYFQADLSKNIKPQIVAYYNNQAIVTGGILSRDISGILKTAVVSFSIQAKTKLGMKKNVAVNSSNLIRIDERIKGNPYLNYSYFLTYVLIAHVFQVLSTLVAVWCLGIEFKKGTTIELYKTAQNNVWAAVFGKISLYWSIFFIYMSLTYFLYIKIYPAPFEGNFLIVMSGIALFTLAYMLMGVLFVAITSNYREAISFGAIYTSLAFSFSGMTYPTIAMTSLGDGYSKVLPIRPFINLLVDQALKDIPIEYDYHYLGWLCIYIVLGLSSLVLLKKHLKDKTLWYRF